MDNQINRSLRTTLIFKGIKEEPHETWIQTEKTLCEVIARQLNMDVGHVVDMIERAHRGNSSQTRQGPRHIYVKFYSWKDSELIKENFAEQNRKHPKMNLRAEQMFSSDLTKRRNTAMVERKKLINDKTISNGYVKFPATLIVKRKKTDKFYIKHESYWSLKSEGIDNRVRGDGWVGFLRCGWAVAVFGLVCCPNLGWPMGLRVGAVCPCRGGPACFLPYTCVWCTHSAHVSTCTHYNQSGHWEQHITDNRNLMLSPPSEILPLFSLYFIGWLFVFAICSPYWDKMSIFWKTLDTV